jgi:hypothetical protein
MFVIYLHIKWDTPANKASAVTTPNLEGKENVPSPAILYFTKQKITRQQNWIPLEHLLTYFILVC